MAKLPATSMKKLERYAVRFRSFSKVRDFRFEDFEDKAEALEKQNPGQGYQLAYQETMKDLFRKIFNKHLQHEEKLPSLSAFVQYYDTFLIKSYLDERKAQNMEVEIRINQRHELAVEIYHSSEGVVIANVILDLKIKPFAFGTKFAKVAYNSVARNAGGYIGKLDLISFDRQIYHIYLVFTLIKKRKLAESSLSVCAVYANIRFENKAL